MYPGVPSVNRGDTPESGWIHQKVVLKTSPPKRKVSVLSMNSIS